MSALREDRPAKRVYRRVRAVARDGKIVRVKFCPSCALDRIAEEGPECEFWVSFHHKGKPVFYPHCKECSRREARERRKDPAYVQQEREYQREWRRRWREDPENLERDRRAGREYAQRRVAADRKGINEAARMDYALRQERKGRPVRQRRTVIDGTAPRVPLGPFRDWLLAYAEARELDPAQLAEEFGVPQRRMWGYLNLEQKNVAFDVVDKALTKTHWTVHVRGRLVLSVDDLYPGLRIRETRRGS